jgi:hypothetical protein
MSRLRIGTIESDKSVKLNIELPASVHRDLVSYADAHAQESGQPKLELEKLAPAMLARFMATDRAFARFRRRRPASNQSP